MDSVPQHGTSPYDISYGTSVGASRNRETARLKEENKKKEEVVAVPEPAPVGGKVLKGSRLY